MRAFSISERKKLESSSYVVKITPKNQIQFTPEFKKRFLEGSRDLTRVEFFNSLLDVSCFDKKYVDSILNRWRNQEKFKAVPKRRGRRKQPSKMTIAEMEAEIAFQREVIEQLKKARGLTDWDL